MTWDEFDKVAAEIDANCAEVARLHRFHNRLLDRYDHERSAPVTCRLINRSKMFLRGSRDTLDAMRALTDANQALMRALDSHLWSELA